MNPRGAVRARLIQAALDGPPPPIPATPDDALRAVLDRVDTTVLARRLTIRGAGGRAIALDAANRRLLSLAGDAGGGALGPGDAAAVAAALRSALAGGGPVTVRSGPAAPGAGAGQVGLTPAAVLSAAGLAPLPAAAACAPSPEALCTVRLGEGAPDPAVPEDAETAELADWAAGALDQLLSDTFPLAASLETEGTLWLDYGAEGRIRIAGDLGGFDVSVLGPDPDAPRPRSGGAACG
ncbi:hypothetical protein [Roseicyclus persicicus]|uniref:Uncharacterized protein n=1 Tax=Roseicyclus persicicus TaxID=2650661 RepID=A0A7X6GXX1_9RHOB|nr:hypothetical protein [Roseibacterium persicicum]NKX44436.1 hypothetical protein [Roseibacterium persicicum]